MSGPVVSAHLDAAWSFDWDKLRQSLSEDAQLIIRSGDRIHSESEIGGLYRHITQAWDFMPGTVWLNDKGEGIVQAEMSLTNGCGWAKKVAGVYRVSGNLIDLVDLTDGLAAEGSC